MKIDVEAMLGRSRRLIAERRLAEAADCLGTILRQAPACLPAHNLVEQYRLAGNFSDWTGVEAQIHEADDIFRFFAGHPTSTNPIRDYLADGWRTLAELMLLLEVVGRGLRNSGPFLEFACGHGRFTRHLARWLPKDELHVSDVVPGSVDFVREKMGVEGFYSSPMPEQVCWPRQYGTVFVLSLFSHLPRATWSAWLERLWDATAPGGVLVFSTHGAAAARRAEVDLKADGFVFFRDSESSVLDTSAYGCAYTGLKFVESEVKALRPQGRFRTFPAHFWANQDGIALEKNSEAGGLRC